MIQLYCVCATYAVKGVEKGVRESSQREGEAENERTKSSSYIAARQ